MPATGLQRRAGAGMLATMLLAGCGPAATKGAASTHSSAPGAAAKSSGTSAAAAAGPIPTYLDMLSAQDGWGTGPGIYVTQDGGTAWKTVTPPNTHAQWPQFPDELAAPDANTAWVVGQLSQGVVLYRTADAGAQWQAVTLPKVDVSLNGLHFTSYTGAAIAATSSQDAWLLLILAQAAGTEYAEIYHTTTGGARWSAMGPWVGGDTTAMGIQSPTSLWLGQYEAFTTAAAPVSHSTDAGATWQSIALPVPKAYQQNSFGTLQPEFFSVEDGIVPVLPGVSPTVLVFDTTTNGGKTWTPGTPLVVHTIKQVYGFADALHGWVATGQELLATQNGGQQWQVVVPKSRAPAPQDVQQLDFVSATTGWAVASAGGTSQLWRTQDGGATWTELGTTS